MKFSKIIAAVASAALATCMFVAPAFGATISVENGATNSGTVKDTNNTVETYTYYKVFDVTKATNASDTSGYAYFTTNETLKNALDALTCDGKDLFTFEKAADSNTWYLTANNVAANNQEIANLIKDALDDANVSGTEFTSNATVADGYYLVTSSLGTALGLATTDIAFNIVEKNAFPSISKTVNHPTATIAYDTVTFTLTVTVPATVNKTITVHDSMESGLSYVDGTFKVDGSAANVTWASNAFTYDIPASAAGSTVVITYDAKLNSGATLDSNTNDNTAYITYSNFTSQTTTATVAAYEFSFQKIDGTTKNALTGAQFTLYSDQALTQVIKLAASNGVYRPDANGNEVITASGVMNIEGLGNGTYYLVETQAPAGYNKLKDPVEITITDGAVSVTVGETTKTETGTIDVENFTGAQLPTTGGMGTTIIYIIGALMVAGAVVVLIARRRVRE